MALVPVLAAAPASAHDVLVSTDPVDGVTVEVVPDHVELTFNEPALQVGTTFLVTGPGGPVQQGGPVLVDNTVRQELRADAPAGDYTVTWRVTSADGHPVSGTFTFTARSARGIAPATTTGPATGSATASSPATSAPPATTTTTPAPSTGAHPGDGQGTAVLWVLVALLALAGLGAGTLVAVRRRGGTGSGMNRDG